MTNQPDTARAEARAAEEARSAFDAAWAEHDARVARGEQGSGDILNQRIDEINGRLYRAMGEAASTSPSRDGRDAAGEE